LAKASLDNALEAELTAMMLRIINGRMLTIRKAAVSFTDKLRFLIFPIIKLLILYRLV
jgi:hypothetical protein